MILQITDGQQKQQIARQVLEALPEWFGIKQAREKYIADSVGQMFFAAMHNGQPVGFLCLKPTGRDTVELAVMGVCKEYHRQGIGRALVECACHQAKKQGFLFMQVKTVQMGHYPEYDATNRFYQGLGFKEFEVFPTLWDENNPCQVYVMFLGL